MNAPKTEGIRYPAVCVILGFLALGTILPSLLLKQQWYRGWFLQLPVDLMFLLRPGQWMIAALIGWLIVRAMIRNDEHIRMGLLMSPLLAVKGFAIGFACSLAMLAFGVFSEPNDLHYTLIYSTLLPGVTEEIFYRAFAFGLLIQAGRMNLWAAALTTAIVFALAHLVRSDVRAMPIGEMIGWLAMLSAGGLFFAWIYAKAPWNLWVVIALHAGMNLWWDIFFANGISPLSGWVVTIARIIPVGIAVYLVVFRGVLRQPEGSTIHA
ncbi:MAG: lysostaphin resistance A-like protein [Phycisphaerales bacterium]